MIETVMLDTIKAYLETLAGVYSKNGHGVTPVQYILTHGQQWGPRVFPKKLKPAKRGQCFMNAYKLSQRDPSLRYCEGYAMYVIPMEHAWCVDKDNQVIDNTWDRESKYATPENADYFGVIVPEETLHRVMLTTKVYGVFGSWWAWKDILTVLEAQSNGK